MTLNTSSQAPSARWGYGTVSMERPLRFHFNHVPPLPGEGERPEKGQKAWIEEVLRRSGNASGGKKGEPELRTDGGAGRVHSVLQAAGLEEALHLDELFGNGGMAGADLDRIGDSISLKLPRRLRFRPSLSSLACGEARATAEGESERDSRGRRDAFHLILQARGKSRHSKSRAWARWRMTRPFCLLFVPLLLLLLLLLVANKYSGVCP